MTTSLLKDYLNFLSAHPPTKIRNFEMAKPKNFRELFRSGELTFDQCQILVDAIDKEFSNFGSAPIGHFFHLLNQYYNRTIQLKQDENYNRLCQDLNNRDQDNAKLEIKLNSANLTIEELKARLTMLEEQNSLFED